jgi:hypothetical protein
MRVRTMSALPPKAHIAQRDRDVRYVPKAEVLPAPKRVSWAHRSMVLDHIAQVERHIRELEREQHSDAHEHEEGDDDGTLWPGPPTKGLLVSFIQSNTRLQPRSGTRRHCTEP